MLAEVLQSRRLDGYVVYEHFEGMKGKLMLGCWAHARRKFFEARKENEKLANEALFYIGKLYEVEREADALDEKDGKPDYERRKAWFEGYDYFYIEGYLVQNHDLMRRAVSLAREAGLKVCIDLASYNVVQAERGFFDEMLQLTDIVFANEQEAAALTGSDDPRHNLQALSDICPLAVLKVGRHGVWVKQGSEQLHCPAHSVAQVVDTTAASVTSSGNS